MKNRKRESCTSGTVRDEDGNILIYSARNAETIHAFWRPASEKRQGTKSLRESPLRGGLSARTVTKLEIIDSRRAALS